MTRNAWLIWSLIAALAGIDAAWLAAKGIGLAPKALLPTLVPILCMIAVTVIYTRLRPDRRIAALAHMGAATLAFTAVTAILSYLAATLNRPLIDPYLVAADRAIGLDWPSMNVWIDAHAPLRKFMEPIYLSLGPQMIALQILLNFRNRVARAWELQWLFIFACLGCVLVSAFWPAVGAFGYFHIKPDEPYVRDFMALRAGHMKIIGETMIQGIIQFPSLHAGLALLYIYAARGIRFLFPPVLALNTLIILTTPAIGGHHFADLWGGAVLALLAIWLTRKNFSEKFLIGPVVISKKMPA